MPLPGFNPLEKSTPPGSERQIATAASVAQLHQRIADLERRVSSMTRQGTDWAPIPSISYLNSWTAYPSTAYSPSYRIEGDTVFLGGLIRSGGAPPAGAAAMTLPDFLRPASSTSTMGSGSGAHHFAFSGSVTNAITGYLYPYDSVVSPGTIYFAPAIGAATYISLLNVIYRRRPDM